MHELSDFVFTLNVLSVNVRRVHGFRFWARRMIPANKKLTSSEVARVLGVSEASVKRWADSGLLPMERTAGGHRRFRPEDVAAFRRRDASRVESQLNETFDNVALPLRLTRERTPQHAFFQAAQTSEAIFDALIGGDERAVSSILVNLYLHDFSVAVIADAALCPAMRKVGDLWQRGELTVAQEHVATRAAIDALVALRSALHLPERTRCAALCCSAEEDFHEMPVSLSTLVLESCGWDVASLGTSTPFYALAEAVRRFRPRLVCVASTVLYDLERAAREYPEVRDASSSVGATLLLGGAGFASDAVRRRFPADAYADSFRQLEDFALARDKLCDQLRDNLSEQKGA